VTKKAFGGKYEKSEMKRRIKKNKKKNGENWNKHDYFLSLI
jgi:hypothetical protein